MCCLNLQTYVIQRATAEYVLELNELLLCILDADEIIIYIKKRNGLDDVE